MPIGSLPIGGDYLSAGGAGGGSGSGSGGAGGAVGGQSQPCDPDTEQAMAGYRRWLGFMGDKDDCCCPCAFFVDDFDDETVATALVQESGTWTESGTPDGDISTTDANAILYLCTSRWSKEWGVMATVTLDDLEIGDQIKLSVGGVGPRIIAEITCEDQALGGTIDSLALSVQDTNGTEVATGFVGVDGTDAQFTAMLCTGPDGVRVRVLTSPTGGVDIACTNAVSPITTNRVSIETGTLTGTATFEFLSVEEIDGFDCPCSCVLKEDVFARADNDDPGSEWSEISGDWDISDEKLVTSDSDATCRFFGSAESLPNADALVEADITGTAAGDQVGIYVGDVGNAYYLEFAAGAGNGKAVLEVGGSVVTECAVTAIPGTTYSIRAQLVNDIGGGIGGWPLLTGALEVDGTVYLTSGQLNPQGVAIGAWAGTLSGEARFDNFRVRDICGPCPPISKCAWVNDPDTEHQQFKVTVADLTVSSCTDLNGEYFVEYEGKDNGAGGPDCLWALNFSPTCGYDRIEMHVGGSGAFDENSVVEVVIGDTTGVLSGIFFRNNIDNTCAGATPASICPQAIPTITCYEVDLVDCSATATVETV